MMREENREMRSENREVRIETRDKKQPWVKPELIILKDDAIEAYRDVFKIVNKESKNN